mmetsp:Transcript_126342/g.404483  ORF Transcript_126342/g.404483 Transcript_126342/m.404483 type:complete len:227 (+) Transcript_126342:277-957(+)
MLLIQLWSRRGPLRGHARATTSTPDNMGQLLAQCTLTKPGYLIGLLASSPRTSRGQTTPAESRTTTKRALADHRDERLSPTTFGVTSRLHTTKSTSNRTLGKIRRKWHIEARASTLGTPAIKSFASPITSLNFCSGQRLATALAACSRACRTAQGLALHSGGSSRPCAQRGGASEKSRALGSTQRRRRQRRSHDAAAKGSPCATSRSSACWKIGKAGGNNLCPRSI